MMVGMNSRGREGCHFKATAPPYLLALLQAMLEMKQPSK